jgi:hypothetical protein
MWYETAKKVHGIGKIRHRALMRLMDKEIQRRLAERDMLPSDPELQEALRDEGLS